MNIFYLDKDPVKAAIMHNNKHCVKMILESAQMLCTAHRELDQFYQPDDNDDYIFTRIGIMKDNKDVIYKMAHLNHPSSKWVRSSSYHYEYLYKLFVALCDEYTYRYGKVHLTDKKLRVLLENKPVNISNDGFKEPPQCMPMVYKHEDTVKAYRTYYVRAKGNFMQYKKRKMPEWIEGIKKEWEENE